MSARITTNAGVLAGRLRVRSQQYVKEVREAQKENGDLLLRKCKQFTNQRFFSTSQLRRMGHPYATRDPRPPVRPHILNRQSGALHERWKVNVRNYPDGVTVSVVNTAPYAKYMTEDGTTKMIGRPVLEEALRRTQAQRSRNLRNARRRGYYRTTGK